MISTGIPEKDKKTPHPVKRLFRHNIFNSTPTLIKGGVNLFECKNHGRRQATCTSADFVRAFRILAIH